MPIPALIDLLHEQNPVRVWSLIVTIFGDVVMRQGTTPDTALVSTAHLLKLLDLMQIEAGPVRTSLSRLVADKTLIRNKLGRNTFYRLSEPNADVFRAAASAIYAHKNLPPTGFFHIVLTDHCALRLDSRQQLMKQGFRFLNPTTSIAPEYEGMPAPFLPEGAILARAMATPALAELAHELWKIAALNKGYQKFLSHFGPLAEGKSPNPEGAITARIIMVHKFRQLLLRDPQLPRSALPYDWAGQEARVLFDICLKRLAASSETWLEQIGFRTGIQSVDR